MITVTLCYHQRFGYNLQMNACLKHKKEAKKQEDNDKNDDENDGEEEEDEDDDAELYCMSCKEFLCKWCWLELQEETFGVNGGVGGGVDGGGVDGNGGVDGGVSGNGVVEGGGGVVGGGVDGGGVDGNGGVDGGVSGNGVVEGGGGVVGGGVDGGGVDGGGVDGGGANSRVVASSSGVQQKSVVDELQEGHSDNKASKSISHHRHHDVIPLNEAATIFMVFFYHLSCRHGREVSSCRGFVSANIIGEISSSFYLIILRIFDQRLSKSLETFSNPLPIK